jgi:hypothetical protein
MDQMSWHKTRSSSLRVIAGLSAALLTIAAVFYAPIGLGTQSPIEMEARTHLLLGMVMFGAAGTWILAVRPQGRVARLVSSFAAGFNCVWIFTLIGLPVVVASLIAIVVSATGVPRRLGFAVVTLALVGLGIGLLVLRITQPPGEHIFG